MIESHALYPQHFREREGERERGEREREREREREKEWKARDTYSYVALLSVTVVRLAAC